MTLVAADPRSGMNDRTLDRLFDRFRRQGDVAALGEVFDGTAPELLRLGMFLSRSAAEAEDLLQATFVTAIERAGQYDGSRSLLPWLLGILANHARDARRRGQRAIDPERLERAMPEEPHAAVEAAELERELQQALASLPARDRSLLEAVLNRGQAPVEIARELGLASGTVRMQLHRALERLRHALPASLALGGSALASGGRGFAEVRAAVLDVARTSPVTSAPPASSASAPTTIGAIGTALTAKNLVLAALSIVVIAGLAWLGRAMLQGDTRTAAASPEGMRVAAPEDPRPVERTLAIPEAPAAQRDARIALAETALDPLHAALTGIAGRLVEPDGQPAAGVELALLEFHLEELRAALGTFASTPMPEFVVARTRTDAEGRFQLPGARPYGFHALAGTTENPRVPLRMIAEALVPGATVDLGEVVLPLRASVAGRVVDESGAPVDGARVRAGLVPQLFLQLGFGDLRPDGAILFGNEEMHQIVPLPGWLALLEEHFGLATTTTDADGRFELGDAVRGSLGLIVDRPGFQGTATTVVSGVSDGAPPLELRLMRGRALRGRFLTAEGTPIVGAEVLAGAPIGSASDPAVLVRGSPTDELGRFELSGVGNGKRFVALRSDALSPWTVAAQEGDGELEVRQAPRGTLAVRVIDEEQRPVAGATLALRPEPLIMVPFFAGLVPVPDYGKRIEAIAPGAFQVRDLPFGSYEVHVRAPGHATAARSAPLTSESGELLVVLRSDRRIEAHVLDDRNGEPAAGAFLVLLREQTDDGWIQASATADADGRAVLDALDIGPGIEGELWLRTQLPGYAPAWIAVPPGTTSVEVRMDRGGAVHARLLAPSAVPCMVSFTLLEGPGGTRAEETNYPLRLDASGEGTLAQLTPGRWHYALLEGWERDASLLSLFEKSGGRLDDTARGDFEIREGETTELVLGREIEPTAVDTAAGGTGVLHGTIQIDGAPARGRVHVQLEGEHDPDSIRYLKLDLRGAFEFRDLPAGAVFLVFEDKEQEELPGPSSTLVELFELAPDEQREADLRYESIGLDLEVVAGDGQDPVNEADVSLDREGDGAPWYHFTGETDRAGRIHVRLLQRGTFRIVAGRQGVGISRTELHVGSAPMSPIVLALEPGIPCAGRVELAGTEAGSFHLLITTTETWTIAAAIPVELVGGSAEFSAEGIPPGTYEAQLHSGEGSSTAVRFELGPSGDRELRLVFTPLPERSAAVER